MKFGSYAILDNARHDFELEGDWYWDIKSPTVKDEISLAKFYSKTDLPMLIEVASMEVALSFGGTNIKDGKKALLADDASTEDILEVLGTMPSAMLHEIWVAVGKAVPIWGPRSAEDKEEGSLDAEVEVENPKVSGTQDAQKEESEEKD